MLVRILPAVVLPFLVTAGDATKKDLERMQGEWKPVSGIVNGERLKDDISKDRLTIKDKTFVLKTGGMNVEGTLVIDATKFPPTIDTESSGPDKKTLKSIGIYELDGDKLKVCYSVSPNPRPTDFKAEEGSSRALVVYQRVR